MRYAKIVNGKIVHSDGRTLDTPSGIVSNPSFQMMRDAGWKPEIENRPPSTTPDGKVWVKDGLREAGSVFLVRWKLVDAPTPPPRVFVTADLVEVLEEEGLWEQTKAWIVEQGMLDLVYTTKEFDETNKNFQAGKTAIQQALGWTDEDVEALLAKCVKEGH